MICREDGKKFVATSLSGNINKGKIDGNRAFIIETFRKRAEIPGIDDGVKAGLVDDAVTVGFINDGITDVAVLVDHKMHDNVAAFYDALVILKYREKSIPLFTDFLLHRKKIFRVFLRYGCQR